MFSSLKDFVYRHKKKFIVTGVVTAGLYLLTSYAQRKLREWQENEAKKFFEMSRKRQHFESTERTCNHTIIALSRIVSQSILSLLNTEEIVTKLQENPQNKLALWEQLKLMIFTRIISLVYALSILQVTLRVQLNVVGGYLYKDSIHEDAYVDSELQAKYLSLCHHFVGPGVENLVYQIEQVVKSVVDPVSLKKKITLHEIEQMFWSIQNILCTDDAGDPTRKMVHYLMGHFQNDDPKLDALLKETVDILESDEVHAVTVSAVSKTFSVVIDEIANLFVTKSAPSKNHLEIGNEHLMTNGALKLGESSHFVDVNKVNIHLVKLLPVMNDLMITNTCRDHTTLPDVMTQHLTLNDKCKILGANLYEVFSCS